MAVCNLLSLASAAVLSSLLSGVLHGVHDLKEGHGLTGDSLTSLDHRCLHIRSIALAAWRGTVELAVVELSWLLSSAGWLLADELALRAWAQGWLLALPV